MIYSFKIMGDQLRCSGRHFGYTGNVNTYFCEFDIQTDIDGLLWFCVFQQKGEPQVRPIENGRCVIPEEMLIDPVPLSVGCFGTDIDFDIDSDINSDVGSVKRISTNFVRIDLGQGAYSKGNTPKVPTPDVWETLVGKTVPIIGENKNWYLFDIATGQYKDSGVLAVGSRGDVGKSAYQIALDNGFEGTEEEWLASLKSNDGTSVTVNLENGEGENSVQQNLDSENWSPTNPHVQTAITEGMSTDDGKMITTDESGTKVLVGAYGINSTMFNGKSQTVGGKAHAEGSKTIAFENNSHAEGNETFAAGKHSHAEGNTTGALGNSAHAEGIQTAAKGEASHAEGKASIAEGEASHAEGIDTQAVGIASHAEGEKVDAIGDYSHAEGLGTQANGNYSHVEGEKTRAFNKGTHAEGYQTTVTGEYGHTEGYSANLATDYIYNPDYSFKTDEEIIEVWGENKFNLVKGAYSHGEGYNTLALGFSAHTEGINAIASGDGAHAEGSETIAAGSNSHSEGVGSKARGKASHAEGFYTEALTNYSHTEGRGSQVLDTAEAGHAEGKDTVVKGLAAHAEGEGTQAIGDYSHAEGEGTQAIGDVQHVQGRYNVRNRKDSKGRYFAHIVGGGTNDNDRKDIHTLDWDGNAWFAGDVRVGDNNSKLLSEDDINVENGKKVNSLQQKDTTSTGISSFSEGSLTVASGDYSHAQNRKAEATGRHSHAQNYKTTASGEASSAEGVLSKAYRRGSHAEGYNTIAGTSVLTDEDKNNYPEYTDADVTKIDNPCHAEGWETESRGLAAHSEGGNTKSIGNYSHSEGFKTESHAVGSHTEGVSVTAAVDAYASHGEGLENEVSGIAAHVEGQYNIASGEGSHAEGSSTIAGDNYTHSEGVSTQSYKPGSHAEGGSTIAGMAPDGVDVSIPYPESVNYDPDTGEPEGDNNGEGEQKEKDWGAHAEGLNTRALAMAAHAEGEMTRADNYASHAEGAGTIARAFAQHVQGRYNDINIENIWNYAHIVGGGTNDNDRKNIHTLDWDGNAWFAGDVRVGGNNEKLATEIKYDFDETYTITKEEATATNWIRTVDLQGNPIKLSEMQVDFIIPPGEYTGVQYLYFYYENEENPAKPKQMRVTEFAYQNATNERYIRVLCSKDRETFYSIKGYAWNNDDSYTKMQFSLGERMGVGEFFKEPKPLLGLYFNIASGNPVAGTIVRIRGKRINEN